MRPLNSDTAAALRAKRKTVAYLYEGEFTTGTVHAWSGIGDFIYNGKTYIGVGDLGRISTITETSQVSASTVTVTLSGVTTESTSLVLGSVKHNLATNIYVAFFGVNESSLAQNPELSLVTNTGDNIVTNSGDTITVNPTDPPVFAYDPDAELVNQYSVTEMIGEPILVFSGRLDEAHIATTGETIEITVTYASKIRDLERDIGFNYTTESQKALYPGQIDRGFEYVPSLQEWDGQWG